MLQRRVKMTMTGRLTGFWTLAVVTHSNGRYYYHAQRVLAWSFILRRYHYPRITRLRPSLRKTRLSRMKQFSNRPTRRRSRVVN